MKIRTILAVVALLAIASITAVQAQSATASLNTVVADWTLLGTRTVDYSLDRDVVTLVEGKDTYTSLKFTVKNGVLNMRKATIHYSNGESQDIEFPDEVSKVNDGQKIDLVGNKRKINKVTFWYDTKMDSKEKSIVELWGKY